MVDVVYGMGTKELIIKFLPNLRMLLKYASIWLLKSKPYLYGSVDIVNVCNLHCSHCYWWKTRRNELNELSLQGWKKIIQMYF